MSAPNEPMQLTAEDCAALRGATSYVVRLDAGEATLRLTRREQTPNRKDGYERTSVERARTIVGAAGTITGACFCEVYIGGAFTALAQLVRPGDVLRFYASEDNGNGYTRAAIIPAGAMSDGYYHAQGYDRIYVDELCVDVVRKGRRSIERLVLCHYIGPQNSARAVVPSPKGKYYPAEVA